MRIMYVEDNAVNLELVRRIARLGGHEVVSYSNGKDALDALQTDAAHLVLMDIQLEGEMDGIEVIKRLRTRGDQRPIIAITAYAMRGDEERILGSGCNDYLPKPLPISQFITLLAKYDPSNTQPQAKPEPERKPVTSQLVLPKTHPAVAGTAATPTTTATPATETPVVTPAPPVAPVVAASAVPTTPTVAATTPVATPAVSIAPAPTTTPTAPVVEAPVTQPNPVVAPPVVATTPATQATPIPVAPAVPVAAETSAMPPNPQPIVSSPTMEHSDDKSG
ncbi:MAG: response regulator [Chloroflexi bacterium]|nr:response regulator [Chloroflexota bacterium]